MNFITWSDTYSVGVAEIDAQHKHMFEIINNLFNLMQQSRAQDQLQSITQQLIEYAAFHFATEEKYFKEFNYEDKDAHMLSHSAYVAKIQEFLPQNTKSSPIVPNDILHFLEDWWIGHVTGMDQKYVPCFTSHGLS
jgi:hemerythrin-like metal-binding protein